MAIAVAESISPALIERGEVKKYMLFKSEREEVSLLVLSPGAKIREHKHTEDMEIYCHVSDKKSTVCYPGHKHSLENCTDKPMEVISIKTLI